MWVQAYEATRDAGSETVNDVIVLDLGLPDCSCCARGVTAVFIFYEQIAHKAGDCSP